MIISRQRLRQLLLARLLPSVPPPASASQPHSCFNFVSLGTVRWGTHVTGYDEDERRVCVHLSDGSSVDAACLVAADGMVLSVGA